MAKAAGLGVVLLLLLLRGASLAWPPEWPCCAWRAESVEWPVGASQCPAEGTGPDANASYCCGLCFSVEEAQEEEAWPDGDAACPAAHDQEEPPLRSAAASEPGSLASALDLIIPGVFLLLFFCAWLWLRDQEEGPSSIFGPVGGPSSSLVLSQLQSRDLPPDYGACARPAAPPLARSPRDSPGLPGEPPTEGVISSPLGILGAPPEEEEEVATGGPPEEAALPAEQPRS